MAMTSVHLEEHDPVRLGSWPTPMERAPRLAAALGLDPSDLWIKRDDLCGLGAGGNKVRKLEWTCGQAVAAGADVLVTTGAPQSNHARLTAAAAARIGCAAVLVLGATAGSSSGGNLILDGLLGARVVWAGAIGDEALAHRAEQVVEELTSSGRRPFVIPFGGSSPVGALGYLEGGAELDRQVPGLRHVITALGSGGTMAGLVAALGADRVLGVHCGAVADPADAVTRLLDGMGVPFTPLRIRLDQVGSGYAQLQPAVWDALQLAAHTEGVVLDPVYTGRALAGLAAAVQEGEVSRGEQTVLLHSGGLPGLFGHPDAVDRAGDLLG